MPPQTADGTPGSPRSPLTGPPSSTVAPALAEGVELIGEMQGSGYRQPPALVRRSDGQVLQLTPLLYRVLGAIDGTRNAEQIAEVVSAAENRSIRSGDVQTLVVSHLLPLGLLRLADGSQPELKKSDPLLRMRFRVVATDPARTRRLTRPFGVLFSPFVVIPVLIAFAAICWWLLLEKGLASATHEAFARPELLALVFLVTVLSAGFHEFGHAAAAARAGAAPGRMGAGLYLVWPAFFTDVTDSYRLGRRGRLMTDAGGLYFNAIVAVVIVGVWWFTRFDALLLVVVAQLVLMVRQLVPIVRFDGYHLLADTAGVPDLFQRIRPTLLSLLPWRWNDAEARALKPGARAIITVWVIVVVPLLLFMLVALVLSLPRVVGTAWQGVQEQATLAGTGWGQGDALAAAGHALGIVAIAIPAAGLVYILIRLVRQTIRSAWRGTAGKPVRRAVALSALVAVFAGVAFAWWPDPQNYRPIQPYEAGTLASAASRFAPPAPGIREGQQGSTVAMLPEGTQLRGPEEPLLALVMVPREAPVTGGAPAGAIAAPSWVFPFNRPASASGENTQALAVNTQDGSVVYDVAFALVWADGNQVDTTNEAYAFASCTGCGAVAVSFQVVLITGHADVVVPQNLSAAVNYECVDCVAFALASQLVLTLDGPLSEESIAELNRIWAEIAAYEATIRDRPLSEIADALNGFKQQIVDVLRSPPGTATPGATPTPGTARTPTAEPTRAASPAPTTGGTPAPGASASPTPRPTGGQSEPTVSTEPTPVSTAEPTPVSTPSPGAG